MVDSDDEYERRRRDKFRGERADYPTGIGGRERRDENRRREDWPDRGRDGWVARERGGGRREFGAGREFARTRERFSPVRHDMSPPMKRMRPDWEERRYPYEAPPVNYGGAYGGHDFPLGGGLPIGGGPGGGRVDEIGPTQPPAMSFKSFMEQCDDNITEEEALRRYNEYKMEFKRQQLNEFFISHKEEEWFKSKYHPEEYIKRKEEQLANLQRRVTVFSELLETARLDDISVDADQSDQLLKLLDCVVIKLEGGTDFDLQVLDQAPEEEVKVVQDGEEKKPFILGEDSDEGGEIKDKATDAPLSAELTDEQIELQKKAKEYLQQKEPATSHEIRKRKRSSSSHSSDSSSSSDSEDEPLAPGMETQEPPTLGLELGDEVVEASNKVVEETTDSQVDGKVVVAENGLKPPGEDGAISSIQNASVVEEIKIDEKEEELKPRPLHKTASIFLRNLAPTITKQEVEAMCRRYSGFLRAAIADPQPERRWFRRGWVTFQRHVNIKDICWNLNNIRLRDCELGAIVNRDLSRRVRTVNGITSHQTVVKSDIKLSAKIIQNLDTRFGLWLPGTVDLESNNMQLASLSSSANPVLKNITDYLIEEASAEEEALLGGSDLSIEEKGNGDAIERDPLFLKVLDRLLLYLRVVHSVDYYNHSEYPNEDEMPNRCGIIHARGIPPTSNVTDQEIHDYCRSFETKIGSFLQPLHKLTEEETKKLGLKEPESEVEKFIQSNTQEVGKDKWQCPLCGKKFKGPEFVHKHILTKHAEKVKEVKKEVEYFNNYLRDPKRPQLAEFPGNRSSGRKEDRPEGPHVAAYPQQPPPYGVPYGGYAARYPAPSYGPYGGGYPKDFYAGRMDPFGGREPFHRPRATYRSRVGYRDLDAPKDEF